MNYNKDEWEEIPEPENPKERKLSFWDVILISIFLFLVIASIVMAGIKSM
jgi:hypothetical protein